MASWPEYAAIVAPGDAVAAANDVERTEWDDGHVRQAKVFTAEAAIREVSALVPHANLPAFRTWLSAHAHAYFDVTDVDGRTVKMRVIGGAGGVVLRQLNRAGAAPMWEARCRLESEG